MKNPVVEAVIDEHRNNHNEALKLTGTKRLSRAVIERRAAIFKNANSGGAVERKHVKMLHRMTTDLSTCTRYFWGVFGRGVTEAATSALFKIEMSHRLDSLETREASARQYEASLVYRRKCAGMPINDPELEVYIERLAVISDTFEQFPEIVGAVLIQWARIELSDMLDLRRRRMNNRRYLSLSDPDNAKGVRTDAVP